MNISTVNELIQSLESAGELSIKERKYLDVMRWAIRVAGERDAALNAERVWEKTMMEACGEDGPASVANEIRSLRALRDTALTELRAQVEQLAAENVAMKAGVTYFAYSPEYGFDYFKDKQSAIDTALAEIDAYREDADDGWSEDVQRVSWGIVIQQAQGFDAQGLHTSDSRHTYQTCNYRLVDSVETPTTDRIVAWIKADGLEEEPFGFVSRSGDLVVIELNGDQHIRYGMPVFVKALREGAK
ncbi:hypothetical protein HPN29_10555 [Klebsiella pneumoniae]|nr:hypothetical protein [Klebsiella pneumoniae]